jgi:uncharacterized tellurite resistance protein B-like protein
MTKLSSWEKYKTSDESVICIVAVVSLCVSLCKVDGDMTDYEKQEIINLIPHDKDDEELLVHLIEEFNKNEEDYVFHAQNIKKYLDGKKLVLQFILATLYKLAMSDRVMDPEEKKMISKTYEIFDV